MGTDDIEKLCELFPNRQRQELEDCLSSKCGLQQAITSLLQSNSSLILSDEDDDDLMLTVLSKGPSLESELQKLQKKFSNGPKEKLKVDEEDILNDSITYYKDPDFDPTKRLRIVYSGQPAADTGGVVRQFYTQLLSAINDTFFQGDDYRLPVYNSNEASSGSFMLVGKIIVHSILQGGPGLPIFSPGIYYYLAKGDVTEAITGLSIVDCSLEMRADIDMVSVLFLFFVFSNAFKEELRSCRVVDFYKIKGLHGQYIAQLLHHGFTSKQML